MKKVLIAMIMIATLLMLVPTSKVFAKENEDMIINKMGASMTKEEYAYIKDKFGELFVDLATEEFIEDALAGNVSKIETYPTQNSRVDIPTVDGLSLDIAIFANGSKGQYALLASARWSALPTMRSFDIMGFRWNNNFVIDTWKTFQRTDAGETNYSLTGTNTKKLSNGIGTSMNLVNGASKFIICEMGIVGHFTSATPTTVTGSYQHAWSDVTLAQSQNYTFSSSGIGGVFNYPANIKGSYSNFQGYTASFTPKIS